MSLWRHLTSASSSKLWISSRTPPLDSGPAAIHLTPIHGQYTWASWPLITPNPTAISTKSATRTSPMRWNKKRLTRKSSDQQHATVVDPWTRSNIPRHTSSTYGLNRGRFSKDASRNTHHPAPFTCLQCRVQTSRNRVVYRHSTQWRDFGDVHGQLTAAAPRLVPVRLYSSAASSSPPFKVPPIPPSPSTSISSSLSPSAASASLTGESLIARTKRPISHVEKIRRKLEQYLRARDPDSLYKEFWHICREESIENQKQIWSRARLKQSLIYRLFNAPGKPTMTRTSQPTIRVVYSTATTARGDGVDSHDTSGSGLSDGGQGSSSVAARNSNSSNSTSEYMLHFVSSSHPARLLQIHRYFEEVLGIPAGSDARLALIVALCSQGDMLTAERFFRIYRRQAGEQMYGAMIRGWVSKTDKRLEVHGAATDDQLQMLSKRRSGRINSAMELFYEMQQCGITPSFETYHTLTVGLATYKNDLEAAELMLQHMILRKGKPYVQVLHILLREYGRRGDYEAMRRIWGLYSEYGLRLRPISGNVLLKAVFQLRDSQVQAMIDRSREERRSQQQQQQQSGDNGSDAEQSTLEFRRRQIAEICGSLSRRDRVDPVTFSTLIYGYGHLEGAQQDLDQVIQDLHASKVPMTTILWTSIVMARIGQRQLDRAETALGEALTWFKDQVLRTIPQAPWLLEDDGTEATVTTAATTNATITTTTPSRKNQKLGWKAEVAKVRRLVLPIPRGVFHALMVGMVESHDVLGMERAAAKMMDLYEFCATHEDAVRRLAGYYSGGGNERTAWRGLGQQEADEYTANILLLGYLVGQETDKARKVAHHIKQHPSWETRRGHAGIEALKQHVFQQARKNEAQAMQQSESSREGEGEEEEEAGELDDDVEIDVRSLTHRLRSTVEKERCAIDVEPGKEM
ncbi:hypothetical protein DFQ26_006510 [Actinomortierella ambigua]|nr:hypothetical protein DFQ26_006510 [Actinomortierella ambigua]